MQYHEILDYMNTIKPLGILPGLSRMNQACKALGHPERSFASIHIAGTNGKGSTAAMIAAALSASGYTTGLFTSPVVTTLRDTIQINGESIDESSFIDAATHVIETVPSGLSEFEWLTTVAFCCFRQKQVDIAVIECGLGGREDATNVLPSPLCAVFTPISLDHTVLLGGTIEAIAKEKSGIIKPGCDVVCHVDMDVNALGVLYEASAASGCRIWTSAIHDPLMFGKERCAVGMNGEHQRANAATALTVLQCLKTRGFSFNDAAVCAAVHTVLLPCRLEEISTAPPTLLDGAHNLHGVNALCRWLEGNHLKDVSLLIGMLADKDHGTILRALAPYCKEIICCTPPNTPRPAMSASALAAIAAEYHPHVHAIEDPVTGYKAIKKSPATYLVAGGSFYTASTIRRYLLDE